MILAVDVGNSNTTVGLFDTAGKLSFLSSLGTDRERTRDQCAIDLLGVFSLYQADSKRISGAILSSVVPPLTATMTEAISMLTGKRPLVVGPGLKTGLNIRSEIHSQLGSDIVAESVAAISKYPSPVLVIDTGTATSMSLIRGQVYEGCIIMPGAVLGLEALSERAAELPHIAIAVEGGAPLSLLGRTTEDAMRSGIVYGHASMVDGMIDRVESQIGEPVTIVATGGNAMRYLSHCRHDIVYDRDLVMDGLYLLYQKNTAKRRKSENGTGRPM